MLNKHVIIGSQGGNYSIIRNDNTRQPNNLHWPHGGTSTTVLWQTSIQPQDCRPARPRWWHHWRPGALNIAATVSAVHKTPHRAPIKNAPARP